MDAMGCFLINHHIGFIDPLAFLFIGRCDPMLHRNSVRHVASPTRRTPCRARLQCYAKPEDVFLFHFFCSSSIRWGFMEKLAREREKTHVVKCFLISNDPETNKKLKFFSFGWTLMKCFVLSRNKIWKYTVSLLDLPSRQQSYIPPKGKRNIIDSKVPLKTWYAHNLP